MKPLLLLILISCVFAFGDEAPPTATTEDPAGRVVTIKGKATANGIPLKANDPIRKSDIVITDKTGNLRLLMSDSTILDIGPSTKFSVEEYSLKNGADRNVQLKLDFGRVRSSVNKKLNEKGRFLIRTDSSVLAVRGTEFLVEKGAGSHTVTLTEGQIAFTKTGSTDAAPVVLSPGEQISVSREGITRASIPIDRAQAQVNQMRPQEGLLKNAAAREGGFGVTSKDLKIGVATGEERRTPPKEEEKKAEEKKEGDAKENAKNDPKEAKPGESKTADGKGPGTPSNGGPGETAKLELPKNAPIFFDRPILPPPLGIDRPIDPNSNIGPNDGLNKVRIVIK